MHRLAGHIAIVTGAGQGIGEAIARRLAAEGAVVVGIDRNASTIESVCQSLPNARAVVLDLTDHDALKHCVDDVIGRHERIDILVNNAGIAHYAPMTEMSLEQWRQVMAVNLEAAFVLGQLVGRQMMRQRSGRIVNIASTQAIASEPKLAAYTASKGGLCALTRNMAVELAPYNVLVNAVAPGCIHTPMSIIDGVDETQTESFKQWYVEQRKIPLGRAGEPAEVAGAVLFLVSEDCQYITGHTLVVDGGLTITF